jgi:predicted NAD/FAD-binding protein
MSRVAVVGAGVSGLVAAHLLHHCHDVTVFESTDRVGGHVNSIPVHVGSRRWAVDTGFIVYNETNYPLFTALLRELGVETQPSEMSFSVRCDRTGLEYNGSSLRQLFVQKRNLFRPNHYRMIRAILRFNREAPRAIANGANGLTLGEYLKEGRFPAALADHYLVPMGSALWSIPRGRVLEMPARFYLSFMKNHRMLTVNDRAQWRVVAGGSSRYVEALTRPFRDRIRRAIPVRRVSREADRVLVDGEAFDKIVFACHSDQALAALTDPTPAEREILGALPYQSNEVVLHTDQRVLPTRPRAWGAWNYHIRGDENAPATMTYNMNVLQGLDSDVTFCVTVNPPETLDPARILYRTRYSHPLYTLEGMAAQSLHARVSGVRGTHYCGAYWGFGFHEDGVRSAYRVAAELGATP